MSLDRVNLFKRTFGLIYHLPGDVFAESRCKQNVSSHLTSLYLSACGAAVKAFDTMIAGLCRPGSGPLRP